MSFKELLLQAKAGDNTARSRLVQLYDPMLRRKAWHDGFFDEDLYQELRITLLTCIETFPL